MAETPATWTTERALDESETRHRLLFQNMLEGFAYCRMELDDQGRAVDFVYLDVNGAFERLTGLHDVVGQKVSEVIPGIREAEPELLETYGRVARTGKAERLEIEFRPLAMWLSISVYSPHPNHFVAVFDNITDRKRTEQALTESNARLVEADRRKDEFLGMLSHELRNPLAPIRNSVYILQRADPASEQAGRARTIIQRQTEHLARLVDHLLDVTRIASGKIELRRERVDLREIVRRTAEDLRSVVESRGVTFQVNVPDEKLMADADATRLAQVVGNLLQNAAKFTRSGDAVTLSLRSSDGAAEISVRDTGVGIDPTLLPDVFQAFVQGDCSLARTEGGLGLGLALVKGITELHGGTVRAESAGKGMGAEFVIRIPVSEPAAAHGFRTGARESKTVRRVLVVDDSQDAADSLAELVELFGHTSEVAYDGPSALEKARVFQPDIVLCDIGLPGTSGYDVARALRASMPAVQLIAVSGYAQPEDLEAAVEAGFDRHVAKPPSPDDIARILG